MVQKRVSAGKERRSKHFQPQVFSLYETFNFYIARIVFKIGQEVVLVQLQDIIAGRRIMSSFS